MAGPETQIPQLPEPARIPQEIQEANRKFAKDRLRFARKVQDDLEEFEPEEPRRRQLTKSLFGVIGELEQSLGLSTKEVLSLLKEFSPAFDLSDTKREDFIRKTTINGQRISRFLKEAGPTAKTITLSRKEKDGHSSSMDVKAELLKRLQRTFLVDLLEQDKSLTLKQACNTIGMPFPYPPEPTSKSSTKSTMTI